MTKHLALIGLLLVAMLTGCSHDESTEAVDSKQTNVSADFVSADEATTIAEAIQFGSTEATTADGKATTRSAGLNKEVQSVTPVPDASGVTAFYVINYKGGGFMLLAADKRVNPVLAVSETSTFPVNESLYPEGLVEWMTGAKSYVQRVRLKQTLLSEEMSAAWESSSIQKMAIPPKDSEMTPGDEGGGSGTCKDYYEAVEPLITTKWNQRNGYNALAPSLGCDGNGKAPAGCIAVAMAQIMKYHKFPRFYNWNAMPDNYATTETAKLMKDIGDAVSMKYGCKGSSSTIFKAVKGFSRFGYTAEWANFSPKTVIRELKAGRPVILRGGRDQGIFMIYVDGHEWVCDGWRKIVTYNNCKRNANEGLHMNWGWSGNYYDGWYTFHDWRPGGEIHNYDKMMIYNIKPK